MRMVQQHVVNNMVAVRTDDNTYVDTPENFEKDYGEPFPDLPGGIDSRVYEPDRRHALAFENSVIDGGPMPWKYGDDLLAEVEQLVEAQQARQELEEKLRVEGIREAEAKAAQEAEYAVSRTRSK